MDLHSGQSSSRFVHEDSRESILTFLDQEVCEHVYSRWRSGAARY